MWFVFFVCFAYVKIEKMINTDILCALLRLVKASSLTTCLGKSCLSHHQLIFSYYLHCNFMLLYLSFGVGGMILTLIVSTGYKVVCQFWLPAQTVH